MSSDTAILGLFFTSSLAVVGFILKSCWESIANTREQRRLRKLNNIDTLIQEFYFPIITKLRREQIIWNKIIKIKSLPSPQRSEGTNILKNLDESMLQSHLEIQDIILKGVTKARPSKEMMSILLQYDRHVTLFKALRDSGSDKYPISLDEPFPQNLVHVIEQKMQELEEQRHVLLSYCPILSCKTVKNVDNIDIRIINTD